MVYLAGLISQRSGLNTRRRNKMKKYKDENILYYTIKIRRIREVSGKRNNKSYKTKMWCVETKDFLGGGVMFCEPTAKKLLKRLEEMIK